MGWGLFSPKQQTVLRSEDLIISESLAQDFCSSTRRGNRRIAGYATVSTTQMTNKKTSQEADIIKSSLLKVLMPEVPDAAARKNQARHYLRLVLKRTKQFQQALDRPAKTPDGLSLFLVGGDASETTRTISINSNDGSAKIIASGFGDDTVLRSSALADERMTGIWKPRVQSPIDFQTILFLPYNHLELTQNAIFRDNVLFWLLEDAR